MNTQSSVTLCWDTCRVDTTAFSTCILNVSLKCRFWCQVLPTATPSRWPTGPSFSRGTSHDALEAEQLSAGDLQVRGCLSRCEHLGTGGEERALGRESRDGVLSSAQMSLPSSAVTLDRPCALPGLCSVSVGGSKIPPGAETLTPWGREGSWREGRVWRALPRSLT